MLIFKNVKSYEQLGAYVDSIVRCIQSAFDGEMPVEEILPELKGDYIWILEDAASNDIAAFCSIIFGTPNSLIDNCTVSNQNGCYFSAATVSKDKQHQGLYKQMNRLRLEEVVNRKSPTVFTQTQNPGVELGITSALNELVNKGEISSYSIERTFMEKAYGRMLTALKPDARSLSVFYDKLSYEEGDAYILLFKLVYP